MPWQTAKVRVRGVGPEARIPQALLVGGIIGIVFGVLGGILGLVFVLVPLVLIVAGAALLIRATR